jgi:lactate dehydrogenase-like 2-hydroxyacid dehydrogenase
MVSERPLVLVTEVEYSKARDVFARAGDLRCEPVAAPEAELSAAVKHKGTSCVIVGVEPYLGDGLYDALPRGGLIARFGVGHDGVDKAKATQHGILVTNTPGVLTVSVAEHTIWLIGALLRHVARGDAEVRGGTWRPMVGCELHGKTLALIGCGAIGRQVAAIAAHGLGMKVIGFDRPGLDREELYQWGISQFTTSWERAVGYADVVSIHLASTPETRHFINAERLSGVRRGAFLVNTARGAVMDEDALYDAVVSGRLGGAALDVFETEPYRPAGPGKDLRLLPNVVLTPHIGSSTVEACTRMGERCLANVRAAIAKRYDEMDLVNREAMPSAKC